MKRVLGSGVVMLAALAYLSTTDVLAQGRKAPPTTKAGTVEIVESRDGKYRFTVRDADGKYLGGSTVGHETAKEAREAVEEMKRVLANATFVSKKSDAAKEAKDQDKRRDK